MTPVRTTRRRHAAQTGPRLSRVEDRRANRALRLDLIDLVALEQEADRDGHATFRAEVDAAVARQREQWSQEATSHGQQ